MQEDDGESDDDIRSGSVELQDCRCKRKRNRKDQSEEDPADAELSSSAIVQVHPRYRLVRVDIHVDGSCLSTSLHRLSN